VLEVLTKTPYRPHRRFSDPKAGCAVRQIGRVALREQIPSPGLYLTAHVKRANEAGGTLVEGFPGIVTGRILQTHCDDVLDAGTAGQVV